MDVFALWPPIADRAELFTLVGASAWWIKQRGGATAVTATIEAVWDVARWWR
ncbi:hypothetical protein [Actinoplanes auranticolor]|uniref:hypothetical protein n=1 Tax=Actinoplanes auranticolor TaxID=47988 RepID=UPI001BB39B8D|nr:hypothetical protein [Actinoplanes auranticolor]